MVNDNAVLQWLGVDERGLGYYLYFLNLRFTVRSEALSRLRSVAQQLEQNGDYWQEIIEGPSWRPQLLGCYALLITHNTSYLQSLIQGLSKRTFVSPQVAVTLGLLHPDDAVSYFQYLLASPATHDDPKRTSSAYQILLLLGASTPPSFDMIVYQDHPPIGASESHWRADCGIGVGVASMHWKAWQQLLSD